MDKFRYYDMKTHNRPLHFPNNETHSSAVTRMHNNYDNKQNVGPLVGAKKPRLLLVLAENRVARVETLN